jgi:hypothetical protein
MAVYSQIARKPTDLSTNSVKNPDIRRDGNDLAADAFVAA